MSLYQGDRVEIIESINKRFVGAEGEILDIREVNGMPLATLYLPEPFDCNTMEPLEHLESAASDDDPEVSANPITKVRVKVREKTECSNCEGEGSHSDRSGSWRCHKCDGTGERVEEVEKWVDPSVFMN